MTDTSTTGGGGVDLARAALAAARAAAKNQPLQPMQKKSRGRRAARSAGRDPVGLSGAIAGMMAERGWEPPEAGGSVLDQWPTVAPELVGKVTAERFDHETGTLHLRPVSDAYATQLRLFRPQILRRIREKTGHGAVRNLQILRPGAANLAAADELSTAAAHPPVPVQPQRPTPEGYREAVRALHARPERSLTDQLVAAALERQDRVARDPERREDARQFTDGVAETERVTEPVLDRSEAVRRAAIARKRAEAAGIVAPRRVFDVA